MDEIQLHSLSRKGTSKSVPQQMERKQQTTVTLVRKWVCQGSWKLRKKNPPDEEVIEGEIPDLQINSTLVG